MSRNAAAGVCYQNVELKILRVCRRRHLAAHVTSLADPPALAYHLRAREVVRCLPGRRAADQHGSEAGVEVHGAGNRVGVAG